MGVRILIDKDSGQAVFYCSTTDWAFGPLMRDADVAETFLNWLAEDPRLLVDHDLESKWTDFLMKRMSCPKCGKAEYDDISVYNTFSHSSYARYYKNTEYQCHLCKYRWDKDGNEWKEEED